MKRNKGILLGVAFSLLIDSDSVFAYKAMTHEAITNHVASRSILSNEELMAGMGFDIIVPENVDTLIKGDIHNDECNTTDRNANIRHFYCGAALEDQGIRSLNHFYDPIDDMPVNPFPRSVQTSPDWALEDKPDINQPRHNFAEQDFSLWDGVGYFLASKRSLSRVQRNENEQNLFLALGHAVHHLQDMAQPAHVRNDAHCDAREDPRFRCGAWLFHDPSIYEADSENVYKNLPLVGYPALDLNLFSKARDFWDTGDAHWQGIGLSEFSNWNFVSQDTNFSYIVNSSDIHFGPSLLYDNPVPSQRIYYQDIVGRDGEMLGVQWYLGNEVQDVYQTNESLLNNRASVFSIFYFDIYDEPDPHYSSIGFTFNDETFNAARRFLIPRSVAYSAGLVNYFFRGQMKVTGARIYNTGSTTTDSLGVTIVNASSEHTPGNAPFNFSDGRFSLYYETLQGERRSAAPHDRDEVALGQADVLRDQEDKYLSYQIPISQWDRTKPMTLIFDGIVGEERGIVVKEFYPDPLLAFSVDGVEGESPVPNIITVSASYDMGFSWDYKGAFYKPVSDTTLFTGNRVLVHNAINLGEGELLVHFSYIDYMDDEGNIMTGRSENSMARSTDYGQTWELVDFTWQPLLIGAALGSDVFSVYESIVYTGEQSLAGIRIQHPEERGEPRSFQLYQSNALGAPGSWIGAPGLGTGGLPELDCLGSSSFGFASYLEGDPPGGREGGDFPFDSIMVRTDDGGASYYPLTDFSSECGDPNDPDNKVTYCIQHFEYLGDERLLGWVDLRSESLADYHNGLAFHLSSDGGMTWSHAMNAPFDQACESLPVWEGRVENVVYIGKSPEDKDVMMALTRCQEVYEDSSSGSPRVYWGPVVGKSLFFTRDGGVQWYKVRLPGEFNNESVLLYAGDNGAIPGLYHPEI